jgi:hypothetical protein
VRASRRYGSRAAALMFALGSFSCDADRSAPAPLGELQDAGVDASRGSQLEADIPSLVAAMPPNTPDDAGTGDASDSGLADASTDAAPDAAEGGPEVDAHVDAATCADQGCLCAELCRKIAAASCAEDPPEGECTSSCATPKDACGPEFLAALACRAELPASAYTCEFDVNMIVGCEAELDAYAICAFSL